MTIANRRGDEILVMQDSFHKTKYYWLVTRLSCQVISEMSKFKLTIVFILNVKERYTIHNSENKQ